MSTEYICGTGSYRVKNYSYEVTALFRSFTISMVGRGFHTWAGKPYYNKYFKMLHKFMDKMYLFVLSLPYG